MDLNLTRTVGFNGPNPITYQEMLSYSQLKQETMTPVDVEILKRMDFVYLGVLSEYLDKVNTPKGNK